MSVEVWLVRHGQTDWNQEQRLQGWSDIPLNDEGRSQAIELSARLGSVRFVSAVSSDLVRAIETARLAGFEPTLHPGLRELDFGELEGLRWTEIDEQLRLGLIEFDGFVAPGGEHVDRFRQRVFEVLDRLADGTHAVFTHGGVVRLVRRECGTDGFPEHAGVIRLDWSRKRPVDD